MKTVILAGGFGTRLSEYTKLIPKPMVEIGGKPILWHIMNHYSKFGYNDFVIALGYKGEVIKNYFLQYYAQNNDFTIDLSTGKVKYIQEHTQDWRVTLVDTGDSSMTGGSSMITGESSKSSSNVYGFCFVPLPPVTTTPTASPSLSG